MLPEVMMIFLVLHGTDSHRFIIVEENGMVDFYNPRTKAGDHQHLITVSKVYLPSRRKRSELHLCGSVFVSIFVQLFLNLLCILGIVMCLLKHTS